MPPLVSVVLPTYNRAATLERAIESVLKQTFTDFELIVVDDRSSDETNLVLSKYFGLPNVRLLSQLRPGCSVARNTGVGIAQGRYIAFQDSDDEWLPDKLAKAIAALEFTGDEVGVFYSDMLRVQIDGTCNDFQAPDVERNLLIAESTLDYQVFCIGIQSVVIKRECFDEAGDFDEALPRFIDLDLLIRLSDKFRFIHCHESLVKYHVVQGISTNTQALVTARRYLIGKYHRRLKRHKHHLAMQYLLLAHALSQNGEKYKGFTFILKALLTAPLHARICNESFQIISRRLHGAVVRHRI